MKKATITPDQICNKYANLNLNINIRLLENEDENEPIVLVEGSGTALEMLSELFMSVSKDNKGDSFFISRDGPGRVHFSSESRLGLYIHKTN